MREYVFSRLSISGNSFMYGLLMLLVIVGPLFFIPTRAFSVISSKGFFIFFVGILGLLTYGVHVLRKGALVLPRHKIFLVLLGIIVLGIIGSFFAPSFGFAFLGYGFETTSWLFLMFFSLMVFLAYFVFNSYERVGVAYGGLVLVFLIFALTHIVRYVVGPAFANMGVLAGSTSTLLGSWGDLGIFFGFIILFCVTTLELAGLKKTIKWIVASIGFLAVVLLMVMNIGIIWAVLGLVGLLLSLYLFSFAFWDTEAHVYKKTERVPWFALTLFIISMIAIFFGGFFNTIASRHQNLAWNDVRPSWTMTLHVAKQSLVHNFATGYGPNSFGGVWSQVKPVTLSGTRTDFSQGAGFIPTQIATNGILGAIMWILLSLVIVGLLIRKTRVGFSNALDRYFSIGMGMSILYLGMLAWVYIPGGYFLILLAILLGAFIALFDNHSEKNHYTFSFIKDPRASFFGILGVTLLIIGTLLLGYVGLRKTVSFIHYTKGLVLLNQGKFPEANGRVSLATSFASHDIYHRQLASFALSDINQVVSKTNTTNKEVVSKQVEQTLGAALAYAQAATQINSMEYKNWLTLGDVYRTMVSLGIDGAYERATSAYQEAKKRNPNDATMVLYFAQLAVAKKDTEGALDFIKESLNVYPTADAYIVRAQIQAGQQKLGAASESLKAALALNPYNADLAYQYGLLLMSQRQYNDAILAFQHVIVVNRNYATAYVYLGYAYERAGDITSANKIYEYIKQQFPKGAEAITTVRNGQIDQPAPETIEVPTPETTDAAKVSEKKPVAPVQKK